MIDKNINKIQSDIPDYVELIAISKTKPNEKDSKVVDADFEDVTDKKKNVDDNDKTTGTSA